MRIIATTRSAYSGQEKPAIEGGAPVRDKFLIFGQPRMFKEEMLEILDTLRSGWWGTGPKAAEFEKRFARFVKAKYAVALNSATAGLHLALDVLGVKRGDEVITTPLTFVSTVNVIVHCGAKPVFADVDSKTWNIDPAKIERKITAKTKVIVPVHLHGRPCEMREIHKLARKHKLKVIEDAAHAVEAWAGKGKVGSMSDVSVFSFYATKNLATGEGGMLTTNNKRVADEVRIKSLHGISRDAWKRYSASGFKPYEAVYAGYKYNMPDVLASLGLHQLRRLRANLVIRKRYWKKLSLGLKDVAGIELPAEEEKGTVHARHIYAILVDPKIIKISRNRFVDALKAEGIGVGVHFDPVHLHKFYRQTFGFGKGDLPVAERVGARTISLPFYPHMTEGDIEDVILAVKKVSRYYLR